MLRSLELNFDYTLQNYLRYHIANSDDLNKAQLVVDFGQFKSSRLDFKYHCVTAAHKICDMYENPYLAFSGGIDSQAMLFSFLETKRKFRILIFRFIHPSQGTVFNREDFDGALAIAKSFGLENQTTVLDIDLDDFYTSGQHHAYAERYVCTSPQLTAHMHSINLIPDPVIFSWSIPNIYKGKIKKRIFVPNYKYFSFHRFLADQDRPGVAFFFLFMPEQFYSSLLLSPIKQLLINPVPENFVMSYESKIEAYQEAGFQVVRQSRKLTGFEEYKDHYRQLVGSTDSDQYEKDLRRPYEKKFPLFERPLIQLDLDFFIDHLKIEKF